MPVQLDAAALADAGIRGQEADQGQGRRRLAAARFAGQPEGLAVVEPEAHAIDGLDPAGLELEMGAQVLHDEQRRRRVGLLGQRPLPPTARRREIGPVGLEIPGGARVTLGREGRLGHALRLARLLDLALGRLVVGTQVVRHVQQVARVAHRLVADLGLRMSSRALPTSVNERTTRTTHTAGGTKYHHAPRPGAPELCAESRI